MVDYSVYDFDIKRYGSNYSQEMTIFRIFAPESLGMFIIVNDVEYEMIKSHYDFQLTIDGDLDKAKYYYKNDKGVIFRDPFAYYSDEKYSYVLDKNKFIKEKILPDRLKDIIIYEANVRDFSCDVSFKGNNHRNFYGLVEEVDNGEFSQGLNYLKEIGITHLQLMPILDFDNDNADYNWGYNPIAYNYLKKDFIKEQDNPYAFINELRSVVNKLHDNNIRITLDVVYNHVYDNLKFDLEKMLPGHVFRKMDDGSLAKGSLCGNEIKSEDVFVRAYLIEMTYRLIEVFDIDGIRIDLMGILDYDTINILDVEMRHYKKDFIVYGEGWNMGDVLPQEKRAAIINADKMPRIAMFNDLYRDTIINYICGNDSIKDTVKLVLNGGGNNLNYMQSINYVECHDNFTFFDRLMKYKGDDSLEVNIKRCKLTLALLMFSRGLPFIHAGQEFLRTKQLVENSYNSSEDINKMDWYRREEYDGVVSYFKDLVEIRKENKEFISSFTKVSFRDYYECLIYELDDLMIIINPCMWDHVYNDGNNYNILFNKNGVCHDASNTIEIPAYSLVVCRKK